MAGKAGALAARSGGGTREGKSNRAGEANGIRDCESWEKRSMSMYGEVSQKATWRFV